ncbi:hypothetical protein CsSME_00036630 [Camellia sinensis var. sinensis]
MEVITATVANDVPVERLLIVVIDSDDEEIGDQKSLYPYRELVLPQPVGAFLIKDFLDKKVEFNSQENRDVIAWSGVSSFYFSFECL